MNKISKKISTSFLTLMLIVASVGTSSINAMVRQPRTDSLIPVIEHSRNWIFGMGMATLFFEAYNNFKQGKVIMGCLYATPAVLFCGATIASVISKSRPADRTMSV